MTLVLAGEPTVDAAKRLGAMLDHSVLAIQGPPGAGKTYTGARMLCDLVRQGKRVGITANSHKVIGKLLNDAVTAAGEAGMGNLMRCVQKVKKGSKPEHDPPHIQITEENPETLAAFLNGANFLAGTNGSGPSRIIWKRLTFSSWTKPDRCHWPTCWPSHRRQRASCFWAIHSSWSNR
jgi:hypothetical protein